MNFDENYEFDDRNWDEISDIQRQSNWLDELIDKQYPSGNGILSPEATIRYYSNLKRIKENECPV
jgi:hypothetical protein